MDNLFKINQHKAKWTVLIYMGGDNFLEALETRKLDWLEQIGSTKDVNLIVQYDRNPKEALKTNLDEAKYKFYPKDCARYYLKKSSKEKSNSIILEKLGKIDSGNSKNLEDFLKWGIKNYPAQNYLMILSGHGGGFSGAIPDESKKTIMSIPKIKQALLNAEKTSQINKEEVILGMDLCSMGQAEVAYELKDTASVLIASPKPIKIGWPYRSIFGVKEPQDEVEIDQREINFTNQLDNLNKEELIKKIIKSCEINKEMTPAMAVYDLGKINNLKDKINEFSKAVLKTSTPLEYLKTRIENQTSEEDTVNKPYSDMRDIYSLAENFYLSENIKDLELKNAAFELMQAVKNAVILEEHEENKDAHGISFYFPILGLMHKFYNYQDLALAKETMLDELVVNLAKKIQRKMQEEGN